MVSKFYAMFKRRGFEESLQILGTFENAEIVQNQFFAQLEKQGTYYNAYLRVKKDLLNAGLIKFKLNEDNEKMIYLTDKGKNLIKKISEIETLIA